MGQPSKNDDARDGMELLPLPPEALDIPEGTELPEVRRIWDKDNEIWYYSVIDLLRLITGSKNANVYWSALKKRNETDPGFLDALDNIKEIPLRGKDGKLRGAECIPREGMLRLVQNISGERAEKIKRWLARVGEEKLQDIEQKTQVELLREQYIAQGHTPEWAELRIQNLLSRNALTDEWLARGAQQNLHFGVLTGVIHKGTFGITPKEHHQDVKHLPQNAKPREHYTDAELAVYTLTEVAARQIHVNNNSQGFAELLKDAHTAGEFGGQVRQQFEELTGQPVVSSENFLDLPKEKRSKKKQGQFPPSKEQPSLFADQEQIENEEK